MGWKKSARAIKISFITVVCADLIKVLSHREKLITTPSKKLNEPEWDIEIIERPDSVTGVLKVLEPDARKPARPVLRGESHGNVTFLPDKRLTQKQILLLPSKSKGRFMLRSMICRGISAA